MDSDSLPNGHGEGGEGLSICPLTLDGGNPCRLCIDLEEMEAEIQELVKVLHRKHALRANQRKLRNQLHDPFVRSLPVEIALKIFNLSLPPDRPQELRSLSSVITLGQVCKAWREIAVNDRYLWQSLKIDVKLIDIEAINTLVSRSRSLPLKVQLHDGGRALLSHRTYSNDTSRIANAKTVLKFFKKTYFDRLSYLHLALESDLMMEFGSECVALDPSQLKELNVHCYRSQERFPWSGNDLHFTTVKPRPVKVFASGYHFENIHIDWASVASLETPSATHTSCIKVLTMAQRLNDYVVDSDGEDSTINFTWETTVHRSLKNLTLCDVAIATYIFTSTIMPSLQCLTVSLVGPGNLLHHYCSVFGSFVGNSSDSLTSLSLTVGYEAPQDDLIQVLNEIPMLQNLSLLFVRCETIHLDRFLLLLSANRELASESDAVTFLPHLQTFHYVSTHILPWHLLLDILPPLDTSGVQHKDSRQINSITVCLQERQTLHDDDYTLPQDIKRIRQYRDEGKKVVLLYCDSLNLGGEYDLVESSLDHYAGAQEAV